MDGSVVLCPNLCPKHIWEANNDLVCNGSHACLRAVLCTHRISISVFRAFASPPGQHPSPMEKAFDYQRTELPSLRRASSRRPIKRVWPLLAALLLGALFFSVDLASLGTQDRAQRIPFRAVETLAKCRSLSAKPGPPSGFSGRTASDRWERGTGVVRIRNAVVWTGLDGGREVVRGDVLLEKGLIRAVGDVRAFESQDNVTEIDAEVSSVADALDSVDHPDTLTRVHG